MTPEEIYNLAYEAASTAAKNEQPTPMAVQQVVPLTNEPIGPTHIVDDGLCGFAHVNIKPARGKFVSYLKSIRAGHLSYHRGWDVGMSYITGSQSYARNQAAAQAFAKVLNEHGLKATVHSRLD